MQQETPGRKDVGHNPHPSTTQPGDRGNSGNQKRDRGADQGGRQPGQQGDRGGQTGKQVAPERGAGKQDTPDRGVPTGDQGGTQQRKR